jgi:hypothetical protein
MQVGIVGYALQCIFRYNFIFCSYKTEGQFVQGISSIPNSILLRGLQSIKMQLLTILYAVL